MKDSALKAPLAFVAGSCVCGLIAWGICGTSRSEDQALLGIGMFGISAFGLLVGLVWLVVAAIHHRDQT